MTFNEIRKLIVCQKKTDGLAPPGHSRDSAERTRRIFLNFSNGRDVFIREKGKSVQSEMVCNFVCTKHTGEHSLRQEEGFCSFM